MGVNQPRTYIQADALARRVERGGGAVKQILCDSTSRRYFLLVEHRAQMYRIGSHKAWRDTIYPLWQFEETLECPYCASENLVALWDFTREHDVAAYCLDCCYSHQAPLPSMSELRAKISHIP